MNKILAALLMCCAAAYANAQIIVTPNQLNPASTQTGTEAIPEDQGTCTACTVRTSPAQLLAYDFAHGAGTVTSVSGGTANGLTVSVSNPTTAPAISIAPALSGLLYSTGTAFIAAVAADFASVSVPIFTGSITTGHCVEWASATSIEDAGAVCGSGGGGGTPGGSSGQFQYNASGSFGGVSGITSDGTHLIAGTGDLEILGSSTGYTAVGSANASASNYTATLPANTGTIAEINLSQTWTNTQTFSGTVAGAALTTYLASPPAIGGTAPAAGTFSALSYTTTFTGIANTIALADLYTTGCSTGNILEFNGSALACSAGTTYPGLPSDPSAIANADLVALYSQANTELTTVTAGQISVFVSSASLSSGTSITPSCAVEWYDGTVTVTGGTFTVNAPTGCTPIAGQRLVLDINFTNSQTYSWNSAYAGGTTALPTTSTGTGKEDLIAFRYSTIKSKWLYVATATGF